MLLASMRCEPRVKPDTLGTFFHRTLNTIGES